jgi:hypothetical protein
MRRRLERAFLGGLMSMLALVLERRMHRALAKRR